jgi:hypothetical protein
MTLGILSTILGIIVAVIQVIQFILEKGKKSWLTYAGWLALAALLVINFWFLSQFVSKVDGLGKRIDGVEAQQFNLSTQLTDTQGRLTGAQTKLATMQTELTSAEDASKGLAIGLDYACWSLVADNALIPPKPELFLIGRTHQVDAKLTAFQALKKAYALDKELNVSPCVDFGDDSFVSARIQGPIPLVIHFDAQGSCSNDPLYKWQGWDGH